MSAEPTGFFEKVKTKNLLLKIPTLDDAAAVLSIEGDPATNKYRPAGPMSSLDEARRTIQRWREDWLNYRYGYWVATQYDQQEIIGVGGIKPYNWREALVLNLYYRFSPKAWGRGYASELAEIAVQMGRKYLPSTPIIARIRPENIASIRVAEKIGLERKVDLDTSEHIVFTKGWQD